jgi:hypothetical protein
MLESASNFRDVLALHDALGNLPFRCDGQCPRFSIVDRQKDGYVIAVKKDCCLRCIKHFLEVMNFSFSEDEKYLTIRTR